MRPTLLGSLLDAARHNVSRNGPDVAIFESGTVYRAASPGGPRADEHHGLGALLSGALAPRSWRGRAARGGLLRRQGAARRRCSGASTSTVHARAAGLAVPASRPQRRGARRRSAPLGFLGEVHPLVAGAWDLERTAAFAIDLGKLARCAPEIVPFRAFGAFPPLRQDLAVTLPERRVPRPGVSTRCARAGGEMLDDVRVFDVYTGEQVGEGRRSLALALSFRSPERTLTDEDVAPRARAHRRGARGLGGELRG